MAIRTFGQKLGGDKFAADVQARHAMRILKQPPQYSSVGTPNCPLCNKPLFPVMTPHGPKWKCGCS